ncbi:MAG TPA: MFS transporter [Solirubrobacteraceae bacterium]|nr:MFS transporter [Solirubrobacteraceae bacterium]
MLPKSPRLRRILLAYTVNELGTWFGYVALALGVYDHTGSAIATAGLFVARGLFPALLAPVLVARVERSARDGRLAQLYVLEALLTVGLAALLWHFWLPGVLVLVTLDGIVAVAATALVRASAARVAVDDAIAQASRSAASASDVGGGRASATAVTAGRVEGPQLQAVTETAQRQASAALNFAFMGALAGGPALAGLLVHALGGPAALLVDAATFAVCAGLLAWVRTHVEESAGDSLGTRLLAAVSHLRLVPALWALFLTEAVALVFFSSVEPVEVVYAKSTLNAGALGYGLLLATWGLGAALGAVVFARAVRRPLGPMLTGGTLLVGIAYLGFAVAPAIAVACAAAVVGGIGNGIQWPSLISAVQQLTPAALHGRLMSAVGSLNALCPAIGFALGGSVAALASPRAAMAVAGGVATLATFAFLRLPIRGLQSGSDPSAVIAEEPDLVSVPR